MSLACLECGQRGAFNTLIIFERNGKFDAREYVSSYRNFYTSCASFDDFKEVRKSRFMVVRTREFRDMWNTGTNGERLEETEYKRIAAAELVRKLPRIYGALGRKQSSA